MAFRASETFITAANTVDGRRRVFPKNEVVPHEIAKAVRALVYDDGGDDGGTTDGTPPDVHTCDQCDFVAKSAGGLGAHARTHDED